MIDPSTAKYRSSKRHRRKTITRPELREHERTNAERTDRLQIVLDDYRDEYSSLEALVDVLADARHWCDLYSLSYGDLDRIAHGHYLDEKSWPPGADEHAAESPQTQTERS